MRKTIFTLVVLAFAVHGNAQKSALTTAILAYDAQNFKKAKSTIDLVVKHEKTKIDPKAWFYRGLIYQNLSSLMLDPNFLYKPVNNISDAEQEQNKSLIDNPVEEAYQSFKACLANDLKKRYVRKVDENLKAVLGLNAYNFGAVHYQKGAESGSKEDFMKAYASYASVYQIIELMTEMAQNAFKLDLARRAQLDDEIHAVRFNMAVVAYKAENWDLAKKEFSTLADAKYEDIYVYRNLSYLYKKDNDTEARKRLWEEASISFDGKSELGKDIAIEEAAFYQEIGQMDVLESKLEKAIELDPTNGSLYNVLGGMFAQNVVNHNSAMADPDEDQSKKLSSEDYSRYYEASEKMLLKAQTLSPEETSNYSQLGLMYLSEGIVPYNENVNLGISAAEQVKSKKLAVSYKAAFAKAQTQYEKAIEKNPNDIPSLDGLSKIYLWNGNLEKSIEYKNKIKELRAK